MNDEVLELLKSMSRKIESLTTEVIELRSIVESGFDVKIESNWISLSQIASMVGVSYTAVHKKVHNRIHPNFIQKVGGVLSIPKRLLKELEYENQES